MAMATPSMRGTSNSWTATEASSPTSPTSKRNSMTNTSNTRVERSSVTWTDSIGTMAFRRTRQTVRWVASPVARSARTNGPSTHSTDSDRA